MCQISRETVRRANRRMIAGVPSARKARTTVMDDGSVVMSIAANGKVYSQTLTKEQIRQAYGRALAKNGMGHGAKL